MKKQQILVIGGGEALENLSSEKFLENRLKNIKENFEYNPYEIKKKWKQTLQKDLGDDFEVLKFPNPSSDSAVYEEWEVMFEKTFPYLNNEIILLGHSLGGTFIAKYLNENMLPFTISKILLVAPAFEDSQEEVLGSFNFDKSLKTFNRYSEKTIMYYSLDDDVVSPGDFKNLKIALPNIRFREFEDRGHFFLETFPEIIEEIMSI